MTSSLLAIKSVLGFCLCAALSTSCVLSDLGQQARFKATRQSTAAHQPGSALAVTTRNGSVTIQRSAGTEVQITAELKCISQQRLDETRIVADRAEGKLSIEVAWAEGRAQNNEGCNFTIAVPDANGVVARTGNGAITISGLSGAAVGSTSNGAVTITDHDGPVEATSSNGRIVIRNAAGALRAATSNGSIEIEGAKAKVDARTSNGSITARLTEDCAGPVTLETSNSGIDLTLGKSFAGVLNASTSNGGVDLAHVAGATIISTGRESAKLDFGGSSQVSEVHTSNGAVRIRAAKQ